MVTILPTKVTFNLERDGAEATMVYTEGFRGIRHPKTGRAFTDKQIRDLVVRTVAVISPVCPDIAFCIVDDGFTVEGRAKGQYQRMASFMASEFFCWSEIAEMCLRDILITSLASKR